MNQEDIAILANFEQIWQRVMGGTASAEQATPTLESEEVMDCLHAMWCGYRSMARTAPAPLKRRLFELARRIKCCFRELQLEYFLETGDIYTPKLDEKIASCTTTNLRKIWRKASNLEKKLQTVQEENHSEKWELLLTVREELLFQTAELKQILLQFFR
ncbi:MAG: hypothetical protein J6J04_00270 [Oscillospiraceae bacterium]|nr:hypothetical protein [Oscillospiraceae bacterium]